MAQKSRLNCCHFYFAISNYEAQGKEKQDLIKLLNAAIASVQTSHDYASILAEYESKLTNKQRIGFYDKNPPPYPDFLDNMLSHSLTGSNISGQSLTDLNELLINLKRSRVHDVLLYQHLLQQAKGLLETEIRYQQGDISEARLEASLDKLALQVTQSAQSKVKIQP